MPGRCHPCSGGEEVEALIAGWSACWGEVVLSGVSCPVGGKAVRGVCWSWKWKRGKLAGRVLYPWATLSLVAPPVAALRWDEVPWKQVAPHCKVRSHGGLVRQELLHAAVAFICCIISLAVSNDGGHHSLFWRARVFSNEPRSLAQSYLSSHDGNRFLDFYSVSVFRWGRQWEVSWGKLPLDVEKERGAQAPV